MGIDKDRIEKVVSACVKELSTLDDKDDVMMCAILTINGVANLIANNDKAESRANVQRMINGLVELRNLTECW